MTAEADHYAALGVSERSEPEVIQAAYRALMRKYHPDANPAPGATLRCVELNRAYEVLADPVARAEYDARRVRVTGATSTAKKTVSTTVGKARSTRVPLNKQDPLQYLVGTTISVIVFTALIQLVYAVIPQTTEHKVDDRRHCIAAPAPGAAPTPAALRDCPVITTVVTSDR